MSPRAKELALAFLLVAAGGLFWLALIQFLPHLGWEPNAFLISAFVAAFLLMIVWGLSVLLIESGAVAVAAWALVSYAGLIWIVDPIFLAVSTILFIFGVIGFFRAKAQMHHTTDGGTTRPLRRVIPLTATALVATIATAAYLRAPVTALEVSNVVPEKFFVVVVHAMEPAIQSYYDSSFAATSTVGEYVLRAAEAQGQPVPPALQQGAKTIAAQELSKRFATPVSADDTLEHVFYRVASSFIEKQADIYKTYFPIAYAVALFVTLRFIAFFLDWIVIFVVYLILKLLQTLGIVGMRSIPTTIIEYTFW